MKGKALRRALETPSAALRVNAPIPLISDTTELITPDVAREMLKRNENNRPINWARVEEYAEVMRRGEWELHSQGVVLDTKENVLTGQKRLWAVVYSGCNVYMRVSRGNPPRVARLLDRGTPQTSRDLASRETGRKHSPIEVGIARGFLALGGNTKPTTDTLAAVLEANAKDAALVLKETAGTKKTRAVLMVLAAIFAVVGNTDDTRRLSAHVEKMAKDLESELAPQTAEGCWGKGAAFGLAMDVARRVVLHQWAAVKGAAA